MPDSILEKKAYPQPEGVKLENIPGGVVLTRSWTFKSEDMFIGGMGLFLIVFELVSVVSGTFGSLGIFEPLPLVFGPIMTYFALAHRINSTRFSVGTGMITVRKGPLPWSAARVLSSSDVVKFILRVEEHHNRKNKWYTYRIVAPLRDGKEVILDTCDTEDQAAYLHQELQRCLGFSSGPPESISDLSRSK